MKSQLNKTKKQNVEDIYPLSPMQQGMLFHSLYAPESGVYFTQVSCTLKGNLHVPTFEQAWQKIVEKHSIFRTAFIWKSLSQPMQVVYKQVQINLDTHDWQDLSTEEQQKRLEIFLDADRQKPLQLSQAPLMRLHLIQFDKNTYQFVWSHHHLLLDGWSLPLVFQDLLNFYTAISQGTTLSYQPALGYRNYIAWLQQQDQKQAEKYWRKKLQGFTVPTPLTVDKLLPSQESSKVSSTQQIQLTVSATAALGSFARQHRLTLNNLVQATWGLLLSRYSQETDVVFGATVSGRPPSIVGIESMVGLFINTLPMRVKVSPDTEVLDLLKDLQRQQVEAEEYSYSSLVEIKGVSEVPGGTSLFESIVVFENYPIDTSLASDNSSFDLENRKSCEHTNYPLTVVAFPGKQLQLRISYDISRFDQETISRMLGHFQILLEAIVANPQARISQLPLLTEDEQQQLLVEWNNTQVDYPQAQCIHQLFEQQVEKTPDAVAVVFEEQQLTYRELNCRANQLAHYLRQNHQIKPDTLIGICLERCLEMIVGILGILKAGGAYVPLDPDYPPERLGFMLEDAQVSVILTQQQLRESLTPHQGQIICLDSDWGTIAQNSESNPNHTATPDNLAYVIYTSGSTGKPKGVLVSHSNVVRLFAATEDWYNFNQQDVWTLFHSYAFDFSVWEIWGALLHGGRLVVVPYLITRSPESFYRLLCQEKVTILNQTPSAFRQLIQAEQVTGKDLGQDLKLRLVIFGGEALEIKSLQSWWERHGDQYPQLVNMYGITETTVHVTYRPLSKDDLQETGSVIGRPIRDLQVYLLDSYLQPVPIGVPGEMYVGGAGVTRGYLNRDQLTAERFISSPFNNSKLYKTGDKARYLPNGDLEYLGRIDNQVKIRGFRIELGEIEAVLASHDQVWETVVLVREDTPGDQRLVAYLVAQPRITLKIEEIRQFMKSKLPDYMVPNAFVILEALPLTANGKVDRRALPQPDLDSERLDKYIAPQNPMEEKLVTIWEEVLKVEQVGIEDNFFELGGHSLLVTQLVSRIRDTFNIEIPLRDLFTAPTVRQLAESIEQSQQQNSKPTTIPAIIPRRKR